MAGPVYFKGTDGKLWNCELDGSNAVNVGGNTTSSVPIVYDGYIYFRGTDDRLLRVDLDGNNLVQIGGGFTTKSSPFITGNYIFFQGTDNKLWRTDLTGGNGINLAGNKTNGTPFVTGEYVFFQGTDNRVWRIELDGSQGIVLGANLSSNSPPFVASNYVFFQGTDKSVWRCNLDGTDAFILGGNLQSSSSPVVCGSFVYFQGTDNTFWRTNLDGTNAIHMEGWKIASTPFIDLDNNYIFFQGTDNTFWRCNLDGSNGVKMSGFATSDSPFVVSSINQPKKGSAFPRYKVLTILYAPPGTTSASGKSSSSVAYGAGSTTGTTSSIDKSFQSSYDFSVTAGVGSSKPGSDGGSAGVTGDFNTSTKTDNTSSIAVTKSESYTITVPGPAADGINHDEDIFVLWLNPVIDISIDPENNIDWGIGVNGAFMNIQNVYAGWLKNPSTLPGGVKEQLDAAHLTTDDYKTILSLDPFLSDETTIDTRRFLLTTRTFPYEPPLNATDQVATTTYMQSSAVTNTATNTVPRAME